MANSTCSNIRTDWSCCNNRCAYVGFCKGRDMKKLILSIFFLVACSAPVPTSSPTTSGATCQPTDQVNYIYHPDRLSVQQECIRVTGEVLAKISEADGDYHIRVLLDPQFSNLLTPGNQQQCANNDAGVKTCGLLVVEPVCEHSVSQSDAIATCVADTDPLSLLPVVGQRYWLEGRYVLDLDHSSWAELHPLYRFGAI